VTTAGALSVMSLQSISTRLRAMMHATNNPDGVLLVHGVFPAKL
jgi:hypothetical protein